MFRSSRLQLFALLVGLSALTAAPAPCQETVGSLGVVLWRVLDDESGKPVETVEIRLVGEGEVTAGIEHADASHRTFLNSLRGVT
jgi:hypothetical protein